MSVPIPARPVGVVLGTMEFGRYTSEEAANSMVEQFIASGHHELDTALMYAGGESESILGRLPARVKSLTAIHTKVNPFTNKDGMRGLTYDSVLNQTKSSMKRLQVESNLTSPPIDILYLHAPDHNTPINETLRAMNQLYQQGSYKRFGLSNYSSWEVMEIYQICRTNNYVLPTVYQGMYNAVTRVVDDELMKCLSYLNIAFYAYNPLAGGILTGRYVYEEIPKEPGRYQGNDWAERYRERYWRKSIFHAIDEIKQQCAAAKITLTEASLRWLLHHSSLTGKKGDAVIIGASKEQHVTENLLACKGGPLNNEIVAAFDAAWKECKADSPTYYR